MNPLDPDVNHHTPPDASPYNTDDSQPVEDSNKQLTPLHDIAGSELLLEELDKRSDLLARLQRHWVLIPKSVRQVVIAIPGVSLIAVGTAMLVLPGPGLLVIAAGVSILAAEFHWARRLHRHMLDLQQEAVRRGKSAVKPVRRSPSNHTSSPPGTQPSTAADRQTPVEPESGTVNDKGSRDDNRS
jgi:uncharacterized protein (TIGR02611 family)